MNRFNIIVWVCVCVIGFCGCSGNYPLKGRVTFSDDQSPVTKGFVCFENGDIVAKGEIKPDGNFVVGFLTGKDGIPPGKYRVYLSGTTIYEGDRQKSKVISSVDRKYLRSDTSGLEFVVDGSARTYNFQVDRAKPETLKKK